MSIRFRITAVAVLAVVLVMVAAGFALVSMQRRTLTNSIDEALATRADAVLLELEAAGSPTELASIAREGFAQLVDASGAVVASTPNATGAPPLPIEAPSDEGSARTIEGLPIDDDAFRVYSRSVPGGGVVHVATSYGVVPESTAALGSALVVTIPLVATALGVLIWWLVGRTLRPVEDIRREVAEIGSGQLDHRVPEPGTDDEIDRLAGTMNDMLVRLEQSAGRQRRFVADASHELRSPLTRMRSTLEVDLASNAPGSATAQRLLDDVVEMQHMVGDLPYLAETDAGTALGEVHPLDLDDVVIREIRRVEAHERVALDYSGLSGAHVVGDPRQLSRAVRNVLDNAERHAQSRITIRLSEDTSHAILLVDDDGPGMDAKQAERIFERFTRLDEARAADSGGSGLGLAIARDIVERHGGTLRLVNSDAARGASFELRIPRAE